MCHSLLQPGRVKNDRIRLMVEQTLLYPGISGQTCNGRLSEHVWTTSFSPLPHSAPYAVSPCHRRGNFQKQDQTQANMEGEQKPPERRMQRERQDETVGKWFKIIVSAPAKWT